MRGAAVGMLPYDPERDEVLFVEQFRVGALDSGDSPWLQELVAGIIDTTKRPNSRAAPAHEEAGLTVSELEPIASIFPRPAAAMNIFTCTAAMQPGGCRLPHGLPGEGEDIRAKVYGFDQAMQMPPTARLITPTA